MKVLWLTNTPCKGINLLQEKTTAGGWMDALQDSLINEDIELGIAFYWSFSKTFQDEKTKYWAIGKSKKKKLSGFIPWYTIDLNKELSPFIDVIKKFKPDVIHIHGTEQEYGLINQTVKDIPIVISIQGSPFIYSKMFFHGIPKSFVFRNQILKHFKLKSYYIDYKRFVKKGEIEKVILENSKYVIGRTQWDNFYTKAINPHIEYFHVDEMLRSRFYTSQWKPDAAGKFRILSVMRTNLYKGVEMVLEVAQILTRQKVPFEWNIAGINSGDSIVKLAEKLKGVKHELVNINFIGNTVEGDLIDKIMSSSLFVQTSHIENSPNGLCEAMITGIPIIATFAGGTTSLINNNEGILVQSGDAYSLAGAIIDVKENYDNAINKGKNARERALKRHHKDSIVGDLLDVYNKIS